MAQSFMSNAAIRLHPVEWSSGTGCGVAASFLSAQRLEGGVAEVLKNNTLLRELQERARKHTPLEWTISGKVHPSASAVNK
jgi:hypothetical protein